MEHKDLILLLAGSFLPNNILIWIYVKIRNIFRRESKRQHKLISPYRYYVKFQSDPQTQYSYHRRMQKFWLINFIPMNIAVGVDIWATAHNRVEIALLTNAILLAINTNYSLYANFDTETGDAHAAYASIRADQLTGKEVDTTTDVIESTVAQLEPFTIPEPAQ